MKNLMKRLVKDDKGYGTIELLIIVAAMGILATSLMKALNSNIVGTAGDDETAVGSVSKQIKDMIGEWNPED